VKLQNNSLFFKIFESLTFYFHCESFFFFKFSTKIHFHSATSKPSSSSSSFSFSCKFTLVGTSKNKISKSVQLHYFLCITSQPRKPHTHTYIINFFVEKKRSSLTTLIFFSFGEGCRHNYTRRKATKTQAKDHMNMKKKEVQEENKRSTSRSYGSIPVVVNNSVLGGNVDAQQQQEEVLLVVPHRHDRSMLTSLRERMATASMAVVAALVLLVAVKYVASSSSPYSFSFSTTMDSTTTTTTTTTNMNNAKWSIFSTSLLSRSSRQEHGRSSNNASKKSAASSKKRVVDILLDTKYDETELFYNEQYVDHIYVDTEHGGPATVVDRHRGKQHETHPQEQHSLATYSHRYYKKSQHWGGPGYPILMVLGGEDALDLPMLYPFVHEGLAKQFSALVVSPEHRFYGKSQPIQQHHLKIPQDLIKYLTPDQALLDFVNLIQYLRETLGCDLDRTSPHYCPVITFGGSYPGFLSTMMRWRFPDIIDIAYAASAPLELYSQVVNANAYYDKVRYDAMRLINVSTYLYIFLLTSKH
jgi:pimeloyl-ACP methyl ester carboxylesterase